MTPKQIFSRLKELKPLPNNSMFTSCIILRDNIWKRKGSNFRVLAINSSVNFSRDFSSACSKAKVNSYHQQPSSTSNTHETGSNTSSESHGERTNESRGESESFPFSHWHALTTCGVTISAVILGYYLFHTNSNYSLVLAATSTKEKRTNKSEIGVKTYTKSEVSQHYNSEKGVWVTFKNGVYDVTDFVSKHPGGNKILMAAGSSLEPFWDLYPVHKRKDIFEILEKYRIGNLSEEDYVPESVPQQGNQVEDAFIREPKRHPALIPRSSKPFNGETPPSLLTDNFYTPNELFYVRNHLPVPAIDIASYELEVEGLKLPHEGKTLTLDDIKKLPKVEISATIQCGGNRRSEMGETKPVAGLAWSGGAIGNAKWGGARLMDVLKAAGFCSKKYESPDKIFIQFEGMDRDQSGDAYGASIPLSYILDGNFEAILAYEMNGETIPLDHGYPLRVILPGIVGARSVKWLSRIVVSDEESQSPWQQRDYKVFSPSVTLETVDYSSSPAIMNTPVTSYICSHENGQVIPKGSQCIQGYAFSGGGHDIIRVELSTDGGKTWTVASTLKSAKKTLTKNWAWVTWEAKLQFSQVGTQEIWVKAVDSGYNQQPSNFESIWNYRGLLSNAYHRIKVKVEEEKTRKL